MLFAAEHKASVHLLNCNRQQFCTLRLPYLQWSKFATILGAYVVP